MNFKTSYVDIKLKLYIIILILKINFKTSYVDIKQFCYFNDFREEGISKHHMLILNLEH